MANPIILIACCFIAYLTLAPLSVESFVHPGMLHTQSELDLIKEKVNNNRSPWAESYKLLLTGSFVNLNFSPSPVPYVYREDWVHGTGYASRVVSSGHLAYQCAMNWIITGDERYANKAIDTLNMWAQTLVAIQGREAFITAGLGGYMWLNAAEILRYTNTSWSESDIQVFSDMMTNIFYTHTQNHCYWDQWIRAAAQEVLCLTFNIHYAVWMDDEELYEDAIEYYKNGPGSGSILNFIQTEDGQTSETTRDQSHNQLALGQLIQFAEIAFNQRESNPSGANLTSYPDDKYYLLKGLEYTAKYNLGYNVTYDTTYGYLAARGSLFPIYEMGYRHFHYKAGVPAANVSYAREVIEKVVIEDYNGDLPGYGGLFHAMDDRGEAES